MPDPIINPNPAPPAQPQNQPAPFDYKSLAGDSWANIVNSDAYKENKALRNTKSLEDLITQHTNAQNLIGQNRLPEPQENWTEQQWNEHYQRLGRPDAADKYQIPEDIAKEINFDDDMLKEARTHLHGLGLNQKQYAGAMKVFADWYKTSMQQQIDQNNQQYEAATETLKKEFGLLYDTKVQKANALVQEFGGAEVLELVNEKGLGNDPRFVRFIAKITDQFADDSIVGESLSQNLSGANRAKQEIAEMKNDDKFVKALYDENHPGHQDAVRRWHDAHKRAF